MCPMYLGVKAVVARSIERIHLANLINFGIVPLTFVKAADYARTAQGDALRVSGIREAVEGGAERVALQNLTQGFEAPVALALSARQRAILLAGGLLNFTKGT